MKPAPSPQADLMTVPETATAARVSRRFIEKQAAAGRLRLIKLSARCVRVRRADFDAWLERGAV